MSSSSPLRQTPDRDATFGARGAQALERDADILRRVAIPLAGRSDDHAPLLDLVGDARMVLIGEASHGTHEFYLERARITQQLVAAKGFTAVVAEADWPDAFRVNRYVRGRSDDRTANEALAEFRRFPQWMWRNTVMLDFVDWLRAYNEALPANNPRVGFYGMDLYSLHASMDAVIHYLDQIDREAAQRARVRYACFDAVEKDPQAYGYAAAYGDIEPCEEMAVAQLVELRQRTAELALRDGEEAEDLFFDAEQNARLAKNAERYYRMMFRGGVNTWNLRDTHMVETLAALSAHLDKQMAPFDEHAKMVVWAHNSHLGDARATEMGRRGELNVGQLVRERWGHDAVLIGQTTNRGTVTAAQEWDAPADRRRVRPGISGSFEALFHAVELPRFLVRLRDADYGGDAAAVLNAERLERAIGVIYRPETERWSHYFDAHLTSQFDAVLHFDETRALKPLERTPRWERGEKQEPPETYPFAV